MENIIKYFNPETFFDNVFVIIAINIIFLIIFLKLVHMTINFVVKKITNKISDREQAKQINTIILTLKSIMDIVVGAIFIMELLTKLGIDIRPILTAAGVVGVAVGFGAKRFVEDIISGMLLILEGQIRVGDIIEIGGRMGTVEKLNLKMVTLRDIDGKVYYIRNGMVDVVTNYTRKYAYAINEIGVAYKENIDNVIKVVADIAKNELKTGAYGKYLRGNLEVLGVISFGDSAVNLKFRMKVDPVQQWAVAREFNRLIKNKFDELGIEIPFPQRTLHIEEQQLQQLKEN